MMKMTTPVQMWPALILAVGVANAAVTNAPLYQNNFENAELGNVPEEFLVLDGQFAVREQEGNKCLELPGAPLESFGFLMGPSQKEGLAVYGRILGTNRGRKSPTFAVSLNGGRGYRLTVAPAKKSLEIRKEDLPLVGVPFNWKSGVWTFLRLQIRKVEDGQWKVEGKAWQEGQPEPADWIIHWDEKQEPPPGRPGAWGSPFAGTPIYYDDLVVSQAEERP